MEIGQNYNGSHIMILGGGLAGLSVGYYASKRGLPFTVYEASDHVGGNCVTLRHGDFLYDSGAHRFHDKDGEITAEIKSLLGNDLRTVDIPSKIYDDGQLVNFPLAPLDLARNLGFLAMVRAGLEILRGRLRGGNGFENFESFAVNTYGRTIAERYLLNYSEKLWGRRCDELSGAITGKRLQGLNLRALLADLILPGKSRARHLDGMFYYPKFGINAISQRLAQACGADNIVTGSTVTSVVHDGDRIEAVEINDDSWVDTDEVVSTLPISVFLRAMRPAPCQRLLKLAESLRYRSLILVSLFVDKSSVAKAATVYFPDRSFPFTRLYEPKNRCRHMSPAHQTSLVAEIPCEEGDDYYGLVDEELVSMVLSKLVEIGWIEEKEVIGASVKRLNHAYPVLGLGTENAVREIRGYLGSFVNLKLSGRNGRFVYSWIHDMMRFGKDIVAEYKVGRPESDSLGETKVVDLKPEGKLKHEREQKISV